ncbi:MULTISPECIES: glutamine synthetase [unclassified Pseudomonas]|uniref:glutamine synthetase n=1 Tax=unclassified Pseudomonas TaxID=196821 RepID=UPI002AC94032|nr:MULTISPECIES: glutamine synthetase [unclassified Pseudomonas]MEB0047107.1 glutamine synthetase [Pseudomonas sp. Dout3]MEB0098506.1 glutamine synthetase [Pseudomonas sp. DC1.2]WPX58898.1 glutamine synthetase [Pseudomonas sp. DC1.2]
MGNALNCALLSLSLLLAADAWGQTPSLATCTRSANLLACIDPEGNAYSVNTVGSTIYLRGFEVAGKRYWAQTSSRYGQLTFFTGLASDGEAWVGYSRRVGWTTINRFSSSGGSSAKFTCSRMTGC